jgi:formamidopyrimidine-DNA glycosylase
MPELPEVETIARALHCGKNGICPIVGKQVAKTHLLWKRSLANSTERKLKKHLIGQMIQSVGRRGKFVVITLDQETLLIHLRMSGDLRVEQIHNSSLQKHDRFVLDFTDDFRLVFNDPRKFGRIWLTENPQEILGGLGPEPLDLHLTAAQFHLMLKKRKRQLKPLLLDQTFIAGLGNIYTDEALFLARLNPLKIAASVTEEQSEKLLKAIRTVLREGICRNGASIDWVYRGGDFQNHFQVYQRNGQPCLICEGTIKRILVGQRGTHFCSHCQSMD